MIRTIPAVLAAALLVGACHAPPERASSNTMAPPPTNDFADRLAALTEAQRDAVFMRAISDSGYICQKVEKVAAHAPMEGHPAWAVGCDHGNNYVALASAGDMLQIVPGTPKDTAGTQRASKRSNS